MLEHEEVCILFHHLLCRVLLRIGKPVLVDFAVDEWIGLCMGALYVRISGKTSDAVYWCRGNLLCCCRGGLDGVYETQAHWGVADS